METGNETVTQSWNWKIKKPWNPLMLFLQQAQTLELLHLSLTAYTALNHCIWLEKAGQV